MKLIYLILFTACTYPVDTRRTDISEEPTIQNLDRTVKTLALEAAANQAIQQRNDSILSARVIAHDTKIAVLEKDNANLKKTNSSLNMAITALQKDQVVKTTAITNLMKADSGLKTTTNNLSKEMTVKTVAIKNLVRVDSISNVKITTANVNIAALQKDQIVKTNAIINLMKTDASLTAKINTLIKDTAAKGQLIRFLQGHFYSIQKTVTSHTVSINTMDGLIRTFGTDFDLNKKRQVQISDSGMNRIEKKITQKR